MVRGSRLLSQMAGAVLSVGLLATGVAVNTEVSNASVETRIFRNAQSYTAGGARHNVRIEALGKFSSICKIVYQCFDVSHVYATISWVSGSGPRPNLARVRPNVTVSGFGADVSIPAGASFYEYNESCIADEYSYGAANSGLATILYEETVCQTKSRDYNWMRASNTAGVRYGSSWYAKSATASWYGN